MTFDRAFYRSLTYFCKKLGFSCAQTILHIKSIFPFCIFKRSSFYHWYDLITDLNHIHTSNKRRGRGVNMMLALKIEKLIKENCMISARAIGRALHISHSTVLFYIHDILHLSRRACQVVPHLLSERMKQQRVAFAKIQLAILREAKAVDYRNIITGDESWIYYSYSPQFYWGKSDEMPPVIVRRNQGDKKVMLIIMVSGDGVITSHILDNGNAVDGQLFTSVILQNCQSVWKEKWEAMSPEEQLAITEATNKGLESAQRIILSDSCLQPINPLDGEDFLSDAEKLMVNYQSREPVKEDDSHHLERITAATNNEERLTKKKCKKMLKQYAALEETNSKEDSNPADESITEPHFTGFPKECAFIHYDNASSHNSKVCRTGLGNTPFVRIPQPPYSPDIAICDFYLFGTLKQQLEGISATDPSDLRVAMDSILANIPHSQWIKAFDEWAKRLQWIIENNGEYYTSFIKSQQQQLFHSPTQTQPLSSPSSRPNILSQTIQYTIGSSLQPIQLITRSQLSDSSSSGTTAVAVTQAEFTPSSSQVPLQTKQIRHIKRKIQIEGTKSHSEKLLDDIRDRKQAKASKVHPKIKTKKSTTDRPKYVCNHPGCYYATSRRWNLHRHQQIHVRQAVLFHRKMKTPDPKPVQLEDDSKPPEQIASSTTSYSLSDFQVDMQLNISPFPFFPS